MKGLIGCLCMLIGAVIGIYGLYLLLAPPECVTVRFSDSSVGICKWQVYVLAAVTTAIGLSTLVYGIRVWRGDE